MIPVVQNELMKKKEKDMYNKGAYLGFYFYYILIEKDKMIAISAVILVSSNITVTRCLQKSRRTSAVGIG